MAGWSICLSLSCQITADWDYDQSKIGCQILTLLISRIPGYNTFSSPDQSSKASHSAVQGQTGSYKIKKIHTKSYIVTQIDTESYIIILDT